MGTIAFANESHLALIACLVGPAAMYGFPAGGYTLILINSLPTAVFAALSGTKRRNRCREIELPLFANWRLVRPMKNAAHQSLRQLIDAWQSRDQRIPLSSRVSGTALRMMRRCAVNHGCHSHHSSLDGLALAGT